MAIPFNLPATALTALNILSNFKDSNSNTFKVIVGIIIIILIYVLFSYTKKYELRLIPRLVPKNPKFVLEGLIGNEGICIEPGKLQIPETGSEYTFSIWIYLNSIFNDKNNYRHIMTKGGPDCKDIDGANKCELLSISSSNQSPSIWLHPKLNALKIIVQTTSGIKSFDIDDINIKRWTMVTVVARNTELEIYINGRMSSTYTLGSQVVFNTGSLCLNQLGGFDGLIANVDYYPEARTAKEIETLYLDGPETKSWMDKLTLKKSPLEKKVSSLPESVYIK